MKLNVMQTIGEAHAETRSLTCVTNNNVWVYGWKIQGSFVQQQVSNRAVSLAALVEANQERLAPMEETIPTTLSSNPHLLLMVWQEYRFGISCRKLAEKFTTADE